MDSAPLQDAEIQEPRIGQLISTRKRLSRGQLEEISRYQQANHVRFGSAAISLGLATQDDVLWALSQQFNYSYSAGLNERLSPELIVASDPFSDEAEIFRGVRSRLMDELLNEQGVSGSIAITSPNVGDGKSFFAANLAVAFSQLGGRTLIVDADMRTGRLHTLLGETPTSGLSSVLSGRPEANFIRQIEGLPNLFLLPVGTVPPNPLELVHGSRFAHLIRELQNKFDYVIVDTPAASHGADAKVIASACTASLVLARKGATRMAAAQSLLDGIRRGHSTLSGVVLNNF